MGVTVELEVGSGTAAAAAATIATTMATSSHRGPRRPGGPNPMQHLASGSGLGFHSLANHSNHGGQEALGIYGYGVNRDTYSELHFNYYYYSSFFSN